MPNWKKVVTSGSNAAFNSLIVSSTITGSISGSLTGSLFGTASWAYNVVNGGNVDTSGFVTTSSFNAFTSSINAFTASYNTGSFSGSFIGDLQGNATTADTATNITSPVTQELTLIGSFTNRITYTDFDTLIDNYTNIGAGYGYSGEVFVYNNVSGFIIDTNCTYNSLLSHYDYNKWTYIEAWKTNSTGMLGFYVRDPNTNEEGILTEGYIVLDGTDIDTPTIGAPLWFYQADAGGGNPVPPPLPFRTTLNTGQTQFTIYQRLLGHLCYTDGKNPGLWILRFKPSNDWIQI